MNLILSNDSEMITYDLVREKPVGYEPTTDLPEKGEIYYYNKRTGFGRIIKNKGGKIDFHISQVKDAKLQKMLAKDVDITPLISEQKSSCDGFKNSHNDKNQSAGEAGCRC